jgi:hypothetical protein
MKMNWEKEGDTEFKVYPEGTYKIKIKGYEETTASTGTKQIRWKGEIVDSANGEEGPITTHTALTERSLR